MRFPWLALALPWLLLDEAGAARPRAPETSVPAFRFDPARLPVGRVLKYTKSNRDGTKAIDVYVAITSPTTVDVLKVENHGRWLAHVVGEMDWTTFTVGSSRSWNRLESGEPNLQAELRLDGKAHRYVATFGPATAPAAIGRYPLVVYNFDFIGANVIWPFRKDPTTEVALGVADPDFAYIAANVKGPGTYPGAFPYKGEAVFRYVGQAEHKGVPCRKYAVSGSAFGGVEGTLLANREHGYWELFEHPQADNPAWRDFKFELQSVENGTPADWKRTFDTIVAKAQGPQDLDETPVTGLTPARLLRDGLEAAGQSNVLEAVRLLRAFTAGNPHHAEAWSNLADMLYEAKHYGPAAEAYVKAADLGLNPPQLRYYAAGSLALAGRRDDALAELRKAMELGFENPPGALEDRDLAPLRADPRFRELMGARPDGALDRAGRWRHDLRWLVQELKRKHVDLDAHLAPQALDAEVSRLEADLAGLTDAQIVVRLAQLLARVGDGHTALLPPVLGQFPYSLGVPLPDLKLAPLPLRFYVFPDGVRVVAVAGREHERLLGARVVKVGGVEVAEAMDRLATTISRENDMWVKEQMPARLQVPAILAALGLGTSETAAVLTLEIGGREETLTLAARGAGPEPAWTEAASPGLREGRDKPYVDRYLEKDRTTVVQYNLARKGAEAPAEFWGRVIREAEQKQVTRFVVDLSTNSGGDNTQNRPMVEGLRGSAWLNQPGRLYVIVGRATFSAGMNAAADLARQTKATFVGEPTGSAPSFAGEASPVVLPFSGLRAFVSSRYFQGTEPTDKRTWIAPAVLVEPDFEAWKAGRDRALEAVLAEP
jgi:tetratricopeptide (TPR) repeat protein